VRHPDEVHVLMSSPQKIYNDFCDILMLPAKSSSNAHSEQDIIENLETEINLENMSELLKVISAEEDPNLKKSNPAYWQDLINKGILDQKQATYLSQIILACNDVAHGNPNAATNKPVVINDGQLMGLKLDVSKHHDKKEAEKKQQIRKWIEENSHSL